ncbi:MAG: hypothetical protein ABGY25_01060, partial [Acidimicrobiales bacterium]
MSTRRLAAGFSAALCMVLVAGCGGVEPVAVQGDELPVTTAVVQVEPTATTTTAVVQVEPTATTTTAVVQVEPTVTTTTVVVQVERPTTTTTTAVAPVEEPAGESPGPWMVNSTGRVAVVIHDDAPIPVNV